jgi:hypothetical protein
LRRNGDDIATAALRGADTRPQWAALVPYLSLSMSPIVWNGRARTVTPRLVRSRYVSSDSTLRHAGAQQGLQWSAASSSLLKNSEVECFSLA